jgi:hypothetical protein
MKMNIILVVALCAAVAACGSSGGGNGALDKTFTYGASTTATTSEAEVMDNQVSDIAALTSSTDPSAVMSLYNTFGITFQLNPNMGSSALHAALQAAGAAHTGPSDAVVSILRSALSTSDSCITHTDTSVTFTNCSETGDTGDLTGFGIPSASGTFYINGSFSISADRHSLTWDITVKTTITATGLSEKVDLRESGTLTVTDTTIVGNMLAEMDISFTYQGHSASIGLAEALILDLTYRTTPSYCVTGGTLEAKRVWTNRGGASKTALPDAAAKVSWTDCGTGTIQLSN